MLSILMRISILSLFCLYMVFKVVEIWPSHAPVVGFLTVVMFFSMNAWLFIYRAKPKLVDQPWFIAFVWAGSTLMGWCAAFILLSLPVDAGLLIYIGLAKLIALPQPANFFNLARDMNFIVLTISLLIVLFGFIEVLRGPKIRYISVNVPGLPQALHDFKIAQLSDLHIGPTIRKSYIEKVVRRTNRVTPDMVFITGDIADAKAVDILPALAPLQTLTAGSGKFYVTGNHEYYWDAVGLMDAVSHLGIHVLVNENRVVSVGDATLLVAGITDAIGGNFLPGHHPDVSRAVQSDAVTDFKILLAHRPEYCIEAEKLGVNLQFSGHTHGGQFFPFNFLVSLAHQYYRRLNRHGSLWLYVNPGTGYWGPANRFGIPAEITVLTLKGQ